MSKPKHYKRGKGYYVGYGYMSTELDAKKGCLTYAQNLAETIKNLPGKACADLYCKLHIYLERAK